jgi:hypothetical protein
MADIRENLIDVFPDRRMPLVHIAAQKAVEVVETHSNWPLVLRSGLGHLIQRYLWSLPNQAVA